jgi:hypothetical protein
LHVALVKSLIATLVLVWLYPDGTFFITADSAREKLSNGVRQVDHNMCKLFPVGNTIFFEAGHPIAFLGDLTVVDGEQIAKRLLDGGKQLKTSKDVEQLADKWAAEEKLGLDYYLFKYKYVQPLPGGSVGVFVTSLADGSAYGTTRNLKLDSSGTIISIVPSRIQQGLVGVGDYDGNRIATAKLSSARSRGVLKDNPGRLLYQIEESTIAKLASDKVHGPVDEIVLRPGKKPVWLHKKPNCH